MGEKYLKRIHTFTKALALSFMKQNGSNFEGKWQVNTFIYKVFTFTIIETLLQKL